MLLSVLAMMLTASSIATANQDWKRWDFGMRGHMEDGMERWEKWEKGDMKANHEAVMAAIQVWDYNQLPDEAKEKISEEMFAEKIEHKAEMEAQKDALEATIKNNDLAGFKAIMKGQYDKKEAKWEEHTEQEMAEKMEEHFAKAREYYLENGELPSYEVKGFHKKTKEWSEGYERKKRGSGQYFKAEHKWMVAKVVKTVDADRLEKALARIDARIDSIEDEVVIDLLEGIREVNQEVLDTQTQE